jgi:hypothetical protein
MQDSLGCETASNRAHLEKFEWQFAVDPGRSSCALILTGISFDVEGKRLEKLARILDVFLLRLGMSAVK